MGGGLVPEEGGGGPGGSVKVFRHTWAGLAAENYRFAPELLMKGYGGTLFLGQVLGRKGPSSCREGGMSAGKQALSKLTK